MNNANRGRYGRRALFRIASLKRSRSVDIGAIAMNYCVVLWVSESRMREHPLRSCLL